MRFKRPGIRRVQDSPLREPSFRHGLGPSFPGVSRYDYADELVERSGGQDKRAGMADFAGYKRAKGELTEPQFKAVKAYRATPHDQELVRCMFLRPLQECGLSDSDIEFVARIVGALWGKHPALHPDQIQPSTSSWLATEAFLLQGKDPKPIFARLLAGTGLQL